MKRYVVAMDLYVFAESDADAVFEADKLAKQIAEIDDNHCAVTKLYEQPSGTLLHREINQLKKAV